MTVTHELSRSGVYSKTLRDFKFMAFMLFHEMISSSWFSCCND